MKNNNKVNYFFVCTGLQLINAIEYIKYAKLDGDKNILITYFYYKNVYEEVKLIIKMYPWTKVLHIISPTLLNIKNEHLRFVATNIVGNFYIRRLSFKKTTIIGNDLNPYFRYATRSKQLKDIVFIDDGAGSTHYDGSSPYLTYGIKNKIMYRLLGLKSHLVKPLTFFSSFSLERFIDKKDIDQNIIRHSFEYLRSSAKEKQKSKIIFFIGDPLVERGYISLEKYIEAIEFVKNKFSTYEIIYIPRITEGDEVVTKLSSVVKVQRNVVPFEIFISGLNYFPYAIAGYHSSVHFNVHSMYESSIKYYFIKLQDYTTKTHQSIIKKIWKSLEKFAEEISIKN